MDINSQIKIKEIETGDIRFNLGFQKFRWSKW